VLLQFQAGILPIDTFPQRRQLAAFLFLAVTRGLAVLGKEPLTSWISSRVQANLYR
jgi:hypothetical protein